MLKGRFLGIAPNIGDAFCFLILSQPDNETEGSPQVLARSVIRRRYPRAEQLLVESADPMSRTPVISFYCNDERTPLSDPSPSDINPVDADPVTDIVAGSVEELRELLSPPSSVALDTLPDDFDDGIFEVYGPSHKRARYLWDDEPEAPSLDTHSVQVPQQPTVNQEEQIVIQSDLEHATIDSTPTQCQHDSIPVVQTRAFTSTPDLPAAYVHADQLNDGLIDDQLDDLGPGNGNARPITQDEDVDPPVFDDIAHQFERVAEDSTSDELFDQIVGHSWQDGLLMFQIRWKTDEVSTLPCSVVKRDFPCEAATYVLKHKLGSEGGRYTGGRYTRWARQFNRHFSKIVRRMVRLSRGSSHDDGPSPSPTIRVASHLPNGTRLIRRMIRAVPQTGGGRKRKKPGRISRPLEVKYGVPIPRNVAHALELDAEAGNTFWADAIRKEVASLLALDCFSFHAPDYKPSSEYQWTKLTMIFEVKQDGRRKARLVAGGHLVDPKGINSRSTVVKGISVRLLDLIAHRDNLPILCGDIGNAFITADCLEKIYSRAGREFDDREGSIMIFKKALYGLRSSSRAFWAHFADFLRSLGFAPTRYDRDVWMRLREEKNGYDYVCTHVDDFKIVAKDPERWKSLISAAFLLKSIGPPAYYLGNDYNFSVEENAWVLSCATYLKECVRRLEADPELCLDGTLYPHRTPLPESCHPELDESTLLSDVGIRKFQMLIGMAQWACTIWRLDIAFAVSSLSRFAAAPREHHLELALFLFGYLKKNPNRRIVLDSRPLLIDDELRKDSFHPDFLEDYPDAHEDIATDFPTAYGRELETAVFFDADHAHDHVTLTRRSISGLIVFVGSTPVLWHSKRQGCIATSTYCAEFISMRSAVEEAISIRYMLRCLGIPVTKPTDLFGDNFGVIQSAEIPEGELKKKHIAISYHYVREAIAAKIVNAHWCRSAENFADVCTKALGTTIFTDLVTEMMA